ncbi:hypothetical protein HMPREF3213_01722 [Heyndrickxia coagulans]|uniref:Uncharacterized protein n=1 Tax=Heyndrickxia coagulans TaxID=1398 RepID=A0A133KSN8_HEYCO|nr:hypothetical protein HMPREF3213_01722 [Heyndrickxia coagulans]
MFGQGIHCPNCFFKAVFDNKRAEAFLCERTTPFLLPLCRCPLCEGKRPHFST